MLKSRLLSRFKRNIIYRENMHVKGVYCNRLQTTHTLSLTQLLSFNISSFKDI